MLRCHALTFPELPDKVTEIIKSCEQSCLRDGQLCFSKDLAGPLDPVFIDEGDGRFPDLLLKVAAEVVGTHKADVGQSLQGYGLGVVLMDMLYDFFQLIQGVLFSGRYRIFQKTAGLKKHLQDMQNMKLDAEKSADGAGAVEAYDLLHMGKDSRGNLRRKRQGGGRKQKSPAGHRADEMMLAGIVQGEVQKTGVKDDGVVKGCAFRPDLVQFAGIDKAEASGSQSEGLSMDGQMKRSPLCIEPFQLLMPVLGDEENALSVIVGIYLQRKDGGAVDLVFVVNRFHVISLLNQKILLLSDANMQVSEVFLQYMKNRMKKQ